MIKELIVSSKEDIQKRSSFWNMVSSMLGSAQSAVFLLVVTHCCDSIYAGVFSIATTLGYQIVTIGNYGMRNYHATDVKRKFQFKEYLLSRYITFFLMLVFLISYIGIKQYDPEKALIIFVFGLFKSIDVIEDVFHGEFQRCNRLDVGAICMTIRYIISFVVFTMVLIFTGDLLVACVWETVVSMTTFVFLSYEIIKPKKILNVKGALPGTISLLRECFPLFLGGFLYLYICNAPKYAIDNCLQQEAQAYFAILFMPVFVVNLLSCFVYWPLMTNMAICWNSKKVEELKKIIIKQLKFIFCATVIGVLGAYMVGTPLLTLVYGVDVNGFRNCLVILMIGGGFAAIIGFVANILTIMRLQKVILLGYGMIALVSIVISNPIVQKYEILGASLLYVLLMIMLLIFFVIALALQRGRE